MRYLSFIWRGIAFYEWWDVYFQAEDPLAINLRVTYVIGR